MHSESPVSCPTTEELMAFSRGALAPDVVDEIAVHVSACPRCEEVLGTLAESPDALLSGLRLLSGASTPQAPAATAETGLQTELGAAVRPRGYLPLEKLGEGGMGAVYRALHIHLGRVVALKVLTPERTRDPAAVVRFRREMRAVGKLSHPNIVQATDAGEVDGLHFLAMEFIDGIDLARLLQFVGVPALPDSCALIRQAALGLQHAHEHGLVHRDVKPSNLLLAGGGVVKLLDLGLALLHEGRPADDASTESALILGSFDYIAPEQGEDAHTVDARADLYSLGCTLFHLLCGEPLFPAPRYRTPMQKLHAHMYEPAPSLAARRPDVPTDLEQLMKRLLAKDPAQRFATAAEVVQALEPFTAGSDLPRLLDDARARAPHRPADTASATELSTRFARLSPRVPVRPLPRFRRPLVLGGAALGLLLTLLAGVIIAVRTPTGMLEIESADDDVRVSVERGGKQVTVLDLKTDHRVTLEEGKYHLKIAGRPDLELDPGQVELMRNGTVVAKIHELPNPFAAVPLPRVDVAALARAPVPADQRRREDIPEHVLARIAEERRRPELADVFGAADLPHPDGVLGVALSRDGKLLACAVGKWDADQKPGEVWVWETATGRPLHVLKGHRGAVLGVAFRRDGKRLASASLDRTVKIWDLETGKDLFTYRGHRRWVRSVAFTPDGQRVISAGGELKQPGEIKVWEAETCCELHSLDGHEGLVAAIALSEDGAALASASWDNTCRLWDPGTGQCLATLTGHGNWAQAVAFSPDGKLLASVSYDRTARIWDVARAALLHTIPHESRVVSCVAFDATGRRLITGGWDGRLYFWDAQTGAAETSIAAHPAKGLSIMTLALGHDGTRLVTGSERGTARLWALEPGQIYPALGHADRVYSVAVSPDGRTLASGGQDRTVRLWDIAAGRQRQVLTGHRDEVRQVAFSPDGRTLASASADHTIKLWAKDNATLTGHTAAVFGVAFAPNGRVLASASHDRTLRFWDLQTRRALAAQERQHPKEIGGLAYAPDGRWVASACDDGGVRLFGSTPAAEPLPGQPERLATRVAFLPDGRRLLSGGTGALTLWDVARRQQEARFDGHTGYVLALACHPAGDRCASAGSDGVLRLWQLQAQPPVGERWPLFPDGQGIYGLAYTPEGRHLFTANPDGTIYLFRFAGPGNR